MNKNYFFKLLQDCYKLSNTSLLAINNILVNQNILEKSKPNLEVKVSESDIHLITFLAIVAPKSLALNGFVKKLILDSLNNDFINEAFIYIESTEEINTITFGYYYVIINAGTRSRIFGRLDPQRDRSTTIDGSKLKNFIKTTKKTFKNEFARS